MLAMVDWLTALYLNTVHGADNPLASSSTQRQQDIILKTKCNMVSPWFQRELYMYVYRRITVTAMDNGKMCCCQMSLSLKVGSFEDYEARHLYYIYGVSQFTVLAYIYAIYLK